MKAFVRFIYWTWLMWCLDEAGIGVNVKLGSDPSFCLQRVHDVTISVIAWGIGRQVKKKAQIMGMLLLAHGGDWNSVLPYRYITVISCLSWCCLWKNRQRDASLCFLPREAAFSLYTALKWAQSMPISLQTSNLSLCKRIMTLHFCVERL